MNHTRTFHHTAAVIRGIAAFVILVLPIGCSEDPLSPPSAVMQLTDHRQIGTDSTFGSIDQVLVTADDILILDQARKIIHRFGRDGHGRGRLSRVGQGPGELMFPEAIAEFQSDQIAVLDPGNGRIAVHELAQDSMPYVAGFPIKFVPDGLCVLAGRVYLIGLHLGRLFHEIDSSGEIVSSFGTVHLDGPPGIERIFSNGPFLCDAARNSITHIPSHSPTWRRLTIDDELVTASRLTRVRPLRIEADEEGVFSQGVDEGGYAHIALSSAMSADSQRSFVHFAMTGNVDHNEVFYQREDSGNQWLRTDKDFLIAGFLGDSLLIAREASVPRLFVSSWEIHRASIWRRWP